MRGRRGLAQFSDQDRDGVHDPSGRLVKRRGTDGLATKIIKRYRITRRHSQSLAREQLRKARLTPGHQLLSTPLTDGDYWTASLKAEPDRTRFAFHRPQFRIIGNRSLGIDHQGTGLLNRLSRGDERVPGLSKPALDRDLSTSSNDPPDHGDLEHRCFCQETWPAPGEGKKLTDSHRVGIGDVVRDKDHS